MSNSDLTLLLDVLPDEPSARPKGFKPRRDRGKPLYRKSKNARRRI